MTFSEFLIKVVTMGVVLNLAYSVIEFNKLLAENNLTEALRVINIPLILWLLIIPFILLHIASLLKPHEEIEEHME